MGGVGCAATVASEGGGGCAATVASENLSLCSCRQTSSTALDAISSAIVVSASGCCAHSRSRNRSQESPAALWTSADHPPSPPADTLTLAISDFRLLNNSSSADEDNLIHLTTGATETAGAASQVFLARAHSCKLVLHLLTSHTHITDRGLL